MIARVRWYAGSRGTRTMHDPSLRPHVPFVGLALALLLPALVAGLTAWLLFSRGTPEVHLVGVSADAFGPMRPAPASEALITAEEAVENAKGPFHPNATARQVVLAWYFVSYPPPGEERVVWV